MVRPIEKQLGLIMTGIEPVFEKGYPCWEAVNRGAPMAETKVTTMDDLMAGINQIMDRLSEIEMILNDPMHGLELPEGVTMQAGTMIDTDAMTDVTITTDPSLFDIESMSDHTILNKENITLTTLNLTGDDKND